MLNPRASSIALAALALFALGSCKKDDGTSPAGSSHASAKSPPAASTPAPVQLKPLPPPPAPTGFDVPFKGSYTRTAKITYKNGQRVRLPNAGGTATMSVEAGKVTYVQTYPEGGKTSHVTETYTFTQADVHQVTGGYDVPLVFGKLDSDSKGYSPDSKEPKLEARHQGNNTWEIGFVYHDLNGVQGGIEFR